MARNGIRFNNAKINIHTATMKSLTFVAMSAVILMEIAHKNHFFF
jgi:hypothetical protein